MAKKSTKTAAESPDRPAHWGRTIYIAAPFFNPEQVRIVEQIEEALDKREIPYFSPRKQHYNSDVSVRSEDHAQQIFDKNYEGIGTATLMLAVLDWANPKGTELRLHTGHNYDAGHGEVSPRSVPVYLPDTGTVWEMGVAYAKGIPVVIYTQQNEHAKLNVMLCRGAAGVVYGHSHLLQWLQRGDRELRCWRGGML